jgi:pantoate--beta-alanine ligase
MTVEEHQSPGGVPWLIQCPSGLRELTHSWRCRGYVVGLVPTMGALHRGHLSLIQTARERCDRVVVSIFVNPLQFGPAEDFQSYPREFEADLTALREVGVDAVYGPSEADIYPPGFATKVTVDSALTAKWEGASRPGHFQGVATVCTKLFATAGPGLAFFGEKDAQQAVLVTRLALDLDLGVEIVVCPVVRQPDGLALSSRNVRLSQEQRRSALCLSRALRVVGAGFAAGTRSGRTLSELARQIIRAQADVYLDYAAIVDPSSFEELEVVTSGSRAMVAATIAGVRLVDTALVVDPPAGEGAKVG